MNIREAEEESIRKFVQFALESGYLAGRVLDYGCGKQPYRDLVQPQVAEYIPYDRERFPGNVSGDDVGLDPHDGLKVQGILCTQVIQYVDDPASLVDCFHDMLDTSGHLVMTGPTNWPIVENTDLWRFTPNGIRTFLEELDFQVDLIQPRGQFSFGGDSRWFLGWGLVAHV